MNKKDLNYGNVVETREGFRYLYINDKNSCSGFDWLVNLDKKDFDIKNIYNYRDDLTYDHMALHHLDIVKVYKDYTLKEVIWERPEKPHLTDDEKAILRSLDKCYKHIGRDNNRYLMIYGDDVSGNGFWCFNHLFIFIKDNEKYSIEDLLKEEC